MTNAGHCLFRSSSLLLAVALWLGTSKALLAGKAFFPEKLAEMDAAIEQAVAEKKLPEACA
jgi:hypothetical protein